VICERGTGIRATSYWCARPRSPWACSEKVPLAKSVQQSVCHVPVGIRERPLSCLRAPASFVLHPNLYYYYRPPFPIAGRAAAATSNALPRRETIVCSRRRRRRQLPLTHRCHSLTHSLTTDYSRPQAAVSPTLIINSSTSAPHACRLASFHLQPSSQPPIGVTPNPSADLTLGALLHKVL
jgi:hypothetical protein